MRWIIRSWAVPTGHPGLQVWGTEAAVTGSTVASKAATPVVVGVVVVMGVVVVVGVAVVVEAGTVVVVVATAVVVVGAAGG